MTDDEALQRCLLLAEQARVLGEAPVGCVIARNGAILAEAAEGVKRLLDPTAHAELLAIREACSILRTLNLQECVLYSNAEPCHMCSYAIREVGVLRVVFLQSVGDIGGTASTEPLLQKWSEDWGEAPVVEQFSFPDNSTTRE